MFGWEFPPRISGGLGTACAGMVEALARAGHQVTFVLPDTVALERRPNVEFVCVPSGHPTLFPYAYGVSSDPNSPGRQAIGQPHAGPGCYTPRVEGANGAYGGAWSGSLPVAVSTFGHRAGRLRCFAPFDVIHCHDWLTFPAGIAAREWSRKPLVLHVHSLESDRNGEEGNRYIAALEHEALRQADVVVAVSHYLRDRITAEHGIPVCRIAVVHNGAPAVGNSRKRSSGLVTSTAGLRTVRSGPAGRGLLAARERPTVLFLGRVTQQKGPRTFVEAAALAARRLPGLRFVMAGDGELLPAVRDLACARGVDRLFEFPGFLGRDQVDRLLDTSDLLVMPSESEPFGLVALEAAAHGLPVVLTSRCGARELLPRAPIVEPGDAQAVADAVVGLLTDVGAYRAQSMLNRETAARSSWQRTVEPLIAVYVRAMEEGVERRSEGAP